MKLDSIVFGLAIVVVLVVFGGFVVMGMYHQYQDSQYCYKLTGFYRCDTAQRKTQGLEVYVR